MRLTMLGTGNALVTECYNTCFIVDDNGQYFMVDGGGGSAILHQLKHAGYDWMDMRHIFVTHKHIDHLMGIIWMVRMICQFMNHGEYKGEAYIYSHKEVLNLIRDIAGKLLLQKETRFIDDRLHLVEVHDGESMNIIGHNITFFDIQSTKAKQYGFCMDMGNGKKLTCCGDEPFEICEEKYAKDSEWLLHEAFCLYSERDIFDPYEKHHSTVKDACELAEKLNIRNLLLYAFMPYDNAKTKLNPSHYELRFRAPLAANVSLDHLFCKHNRDDRPISWRMHSMSMSDIIVTVRNGEKQAFYVDGIGFQEAKRFLNPQQKKRKRGGQER